MGTPRARQEAIYEIIAERLTVGGDDGDYENAMDRGVRLEEEAVKAFEFETGKITEKTGFCEDDDDPMICNSPDRLISKEPAALEVKCPGGKNHVKIWLTNEVPDEYEWQVVQYFVLNKELETLYFASYNPDIPRHPLHVIEVKREEIIEKITKAKVSQKEFLGEVNKILETLIEI